MSFYQGKGILPHRFRLVLASVLQGSGLPFADVLTEEEIEESFHEEGACFAQQEQDVFTPSLTLWAFLSQVLHKEEQRSCLAAVSRVIVLFVALGRKPCGNNSGGYCKARAKLPQKVIQRLTTRVAMGCEKQVPEDWLWKGRHVKLTDRYFCSYFMIALLLEQKNDFVARLHHARKEDAYRIKRLGKKDSLVEWRRPQKPVWMDQETYDRMPESIILRQIAMNVAEPGYRVDSLVIVTTLIDVEEYSREDLAALYHRRWLVELDIRAIKCNLGMDVLRCKTPEMVRKEIWTCLLAYNLIRKTMLQAAMESNLSPRQLSFTNAMQTMAASWVVLPTLDTSKIAVMITIQLASLAMPIVGNRPGRFEPRAVKRRPKPLRLLNITREAARALLRKGIDPFRRIR